MSIKVTLEFSNEQELLEFFYGKKAPAAQPEKQVAKSTAKVEAPKQEKAAVEPSAQVTKAAPAASSDAPEMSADDLTKVIVATVARTSREEVLGLLADTFGVKAGKEITDPAIRVKVKAALEAL